MMFARGISAICVPFLAVAMAFALTGGLNFADYAGEPEDVWLGLFFAMLFGSLAALCLVNALRLRSPARFGLLAIANLVGTPVLGALLLIGREDPMALPIVGVCAFGPVSALVTTLWSMRPARSKL